jgi:nucleotide-binding universal stress UspA family protein
MFKKILVPLDGSVLAESALPAAASLAKTLGSAVTLFHVIEQNAPGAVHKDRHLTESSEAQQYLRAVSEKYFHDLSGIDQHVHTSEVKDVAASICSHAAEFGTDLIVMCTHGHGGVREMLFGSIAQKVIARGVSPVFLVRPSERSEPPQFSLDRILLPLDSESIHDDVFPFATGLADAYKAELALLTVIPTFGTLTGEQAAASSLLPNTTAALLDIHEQTTREHLEEHLKEFQEQGLKVVAAIARGDPASEVAAAAMRWKADLLILATHRKAGIDAFWARSVAPNIARSTRLPLLLLPLH